MPAHQYKREFRPALQGGTSDEMMLTMFHRGCRAIRELETLELINSYQSI